MKITNPLNSPLFHQTRNFLLGSIAGVIILSVVGNVFTDLLKGTSGFLLNRSLRVTVFIFHSYVEMIHHDIGEAGSDYLLRTVYLMLLMGVFGLFGFALFREAFDVRADYKARKEAAEREHSEDVSIAPVATTAEGKPKDSEATDPITSINELVTMLDTELKKFDDREKERLENADNVHIKIVRPRKGSYAFIMLFACILLVGALTFGGTIYTRGASVFIERSIEILAPTIPPEKVLQLRAKYRSVDSAQKCYDLHDELQTIAKEKNIALPKFTVIKR